MTLVFVGDPFVPRVLQDPIEPGTLNGFAFVYLGPGWSPGVPARHLTADEAEEVGREIIRILKSPHTKRPMYLEIDTGSGGE